MAKEKKNQTISITFEAPLVSTVYKNVKIVKLPQEQIALRFLHVNVNPLSVNAVNALGIDVLDKPLELVFERDYENGVDPVIVVGDNRFTITKFTVIKTISKGVYHLDELEDGTWRLTSSEQLFAGNHHTLVKIILGKESK